MSPKRRRSAAARPRAGASRSRPAGTGKARSRAGKAKGPAKRPAAPAAAKRPAPKTRAVARRPSTPEHPVTTRRRARAGQDTGKYVYCIIESPGRHRFGPIGIGETAADVYTIGLGRLSAVVSDSPLEILDPTRENVLSHQRVNETVMHDHTVLPMSFGTVFKTEEDVVEFLRSAGETFADVLQKMRDKLEFGLKVVWDRDAVIREIEEEDEDIRRLKQELASQQGSTYFARMQYGRLVDSALQAKSERYVADIFSALRGSSVAARANKPIGDRMILNAAFLVNRRDEAAFDERVKTLGARYDKLTIRYTGPWPPYNFVNIRLKLERA